MTSGTGTCSVRYDQAGNANYNAAPQVVESVAALAAATVPDAPTGVTASAGDGQATVSWTAPASDGGTAITGYKVTALVGGVAQGTTDVGVVTQTVVSGLTNGTTYTFKVAAVNGIGTGSQSAESNPVTPKANQTITVSTHAPCVGGVRLELLGCGDLRRAAR